MHTEEQYILEIGQALAENHAAVMVGAGFSKNAEKISADGREFLNWNQLSDLFYEKLYGDSKYPGKNYCSSLRLAEEVEIMAGRPVLENILREAVPDEDFVPSELYKELMKLPWRDVFTTNYDTLLERTTNLISNRRYNVVLCKEDLVNSSDAPRIVKLHGSFPSQRPFIITEEDYRTYPVKFAPMVNTVQQALLENVFCMVGFSCEDPNFINWIGWIHDHLSKSSSQKIYMIAVTHVLEAQKKLYFEKNIIVIDLEELWPDKSLSGRLEALFIKLRDCVDTKATQLNWFEFQKEYEHEELNFEQKIEKMRRLRLTYPGWIFLPWELKEKTHYIIKEFDKIHKIDEISYDKQIDYMYEYVKLLDIVGRPILREIADCFWKLSKKENQVLQNEIDKDKKEYQIKEQTVYLHLMRTYRELGNWEQVEECKKSINIEILNYEERQFFYAEECRINLFRFEAEELITHLKNWNIAQGDVYWPIVKAYLYTAIGENKNAEKILMNNLVSVRKQLMRDAQNVYLASVEESCVSLVNFIRQAEITVSKDSEKYEKCIHTGLVSWWDENNKYVWNLKTEQHIIPSVETKYRYNLSKMCSTHYGNNNIDIYTAMEYWRFFEKTGHAFRIGNVTCKEGLEGSAKRLCRYYPYWCMVQILFSQETKYVDYLFGRADMALLTKKEVDEQARELLRLLQTVTEQLKGDNLYETTSVYEQAAKVLPEILARFTYKCSVEILDKILNLLLKLCLSNKKIKFRGLDQLLEGVIDGYTQEQQEERIEKILSFPLRTDWVSGYRDPVNYIYRPKKKYKLASHLYYRVLMQLRQESEIENADVKANVRNRFCILEQIVMLEENDRQYLMQLLEMENDSYAAYMLYRMKERDASYLEEIERHTYVMIKSDCNVTCFSSRAGGEYREMLWVIDDIDFTKYNTVKWMELLKNLILAMDHWMSRGGEAEERIRQACVIAQRILISMQEQENYQMNETEKSAYNELKAAVEKIYGNSVFLKIIGDEINEEDSFEVKKIEHDLWMCKTDSIGLMLTLLNRVSHSKKEYNDDCKMMQLIKKMCEIFSMRLLHADGETEANLLRLFRKTAKMNLLTSQMIDFIGLKLDILLAETVIADNDDEESAINKLNSRINACQLAAEFYKKALCMDIVSKWKEVSQNENEFIEIRNISFDE